MRIDPPDPTIVDGMRCFSGAAWGQERQIQVTANECLNREAAHEKAKTNLLIRATVAERELQSTEVDYQSMVAEKAAAMAAMELHRRGEKEALDKLRLWRQTTIVGAVFVVVGFAILGTVTIKAAGD